MPSDYDTMGNGRDFHWKAVDWLIRILVPFNAIVITVMLGVVVANQAKLASIESRLEVVEERVRLLPPTDYRVYIDSKFAETNRRIDELKEVLDNHILPAVR